MTTLYRTNPDTCGNVYRLKIDHDKRTFTQNTFFAKSDAVTITRRQMREIKEEAKAAGYKEI